MWITSALLAGCGGPGDKDAGPRHTDAPPSGTGDTGHSAPTGDTGEHPFPLQAARCPEASLAGTAGARSRTPDVRLVSTWNLEVGTWAWLDELDGDPCREVLVGENRHNGDSVDGAVEPALLLEAPALDGHLTSAATILAQSGDGLQDGSFGLYVAWLPTSREIVVGAPRGTDESVLTFEVSRDEPKTYPDVTNAITSREYSLGYDFTVSPSLDGHESFAGVDLRTPWEGSVRIFRTPFGFVRETAARTVVKGEEGEALRYVNGRHDLDGDGWSDLLLGAEDAGPTGEGRVAILLAPPEGDFVVWDVAEIVVDGTTYSGSFGAQLDGGDLDGDGYTDLVVGAPFDEVGGALHVIRGPLAPGGHLATEAAWTVTGSDTRQDLGLGSAVGDYDGDGRPDLAVGMPMNPFFTDEAGSVLIYDAPAPGTWADADAHVVVTNRDPASFADLFGWPVAAGDLDGEGTDDLVIGARDDRDGGRDVGSIQVLYGSPDLFP